MTVTVATALKQLRERLDEPSAAQWSDVELRRWLNEGIRDIARRTRLYQDQNTLDVIANIAEYTLDADILAIEHILWKPDAETRKVPLQPRAFEGVQRYINETGADPVYYSTYGHPPVLKVQLWPSPTRDGILYIYGPTLPAPIDVDAGTGDIHVIEGWLEPAIDYAEYMALRRDRQETWKDVFTMYEARVQQMIELTAYDDAMGEIQFTGTSLVPTWLSEFD